MRALITGVTGFIGAHLAELSLRQGDTVLGASAHGSWHEDVPDFLPPAVELLSWDVTGPAPAAVCQAVVKFQPDVIYHLAGISIPAKCGDGQPTEQALAVNVRGTGNVLGLAMALPSPPRFIFASTCHVYAKVDPANPFVTEQAAIAPASAYGQTKWRAESKILAAARERNLQACVVRGFHHIGPRQPAGLMLSDWLGQLADETQTRLRVRCRNSYLDLIDVRDACRAYRLLAERGEAAEIYNLGSGKIHRSGDVLNTILAMLGRNVTINEASSAEQWNAIADVGKLQSLGWRPLLDYQRTIADMIPHLTLHSP